LAALEIRNCGIPIIRILKKGAGWSFRWPAETSPTASRLTRVTAWEKMKHLPADASAAARVIVDASTNSGVDAFGLIAASVMGCRLSKGAGSVWPDGMRPRSLSEPMPWTSRDQGSQYPTSRALLQCYLRDAAVLRTVFSARVICLAGVRQTNQRLPRLPARPAQDHSLVQIRCAPKPPDCSLGLRLWCCFLARTRRVHINGR
jgi:hypothetical protein